LPIVNSNTSGSSPTCASSGIPHSNRSGPIGEIQLKQELLIFLTPHVVQAPDQLAAIGTQELNRSQLITNSVSEKELDQFLDRLPVKKKR
jgi:hypothetical protein